VVKPGPKSKRPFGLVNEHPRKEGTVIAKPGEFLEMATEGDEGIVGKRKVITETYGAATAAAAAAAATKRPLPPSPPCERRAAWFSLICGQ